MGESADGDAVYVAVGKDAGKNELTLLWVLRNLRVKKLYLLHVHQPIHMTASSSGLEESEINGILQLELNGTYESLHWYRVLCQNEGMNGQDVDITCISMEDVGEGIVELIYDNDVRKLVMGAAADTRYSEGMAHITSRKAKYVSQHVPHHCKIWFICNGNLIQIREGRFDRAYSPDSFSESSDSAESLYSQTGFASSLIPYEGTRSGRHETDRVRELERLYKDELRQRRETEEALQRERDGHKKTELERDEALSSARNAHLLYDRELRLRRELVGEIAKAKEEIEKMKMEMEEVLNMDCPHIIETYQKERDDAIKTAEELLRHLNMEGTSSMPPSSLSSPVPDEPPSYFLCPISKEIMRDPHVAADGYTYEAEELREWLRHGGEASPITNLRLRNRNLTPNLTLRSAIREWLQQHPEFRDSP
ncbi:PREDICTED: U-box domain-containing protein 54-like isoform X2 [Tarenaya hassleriana]|uniref:U-box domain-containing protein 54-like isoform X2 n=1 Tax=Tarenaya hassleriana TaxID=28532 RepID=UPI00053C27EB|nr:PREDICTED: U-box domain-containing protein 54-like isoform X2 [Tarenaya hassleriana]